MFVVDLVRKGLMNVVICRRFVSESVLFDVLKDDEMKTDADKKIKPKRPRKVIKKSYMEDSYPTYLQVCILLFDIIIY